MSSSGTSSLIGAILGASIGLATGGTGFSLALAALQGATLGLALATKEMPNGARLEDRSVTTSEYGSVIPRVYGKESLQGNVCWVKDEQLIETSSRVKIASSLIGGSTYQTQFQYSITFAIAICEGEIDNITRIWTNSEVYYEVSDNQIDSLGYLQEVDLSSNKNYRDRNTDNSRPEFNRKLRIYRGTETQTPDPSVIADLGAENAPAYRGVAYVVFENFDLTPYGNALPQFKFEVVRRSFPTGSGDDVKSYVATYSTEDGEGNALPTTLDYIYLDTRAKGSIISDTVNPKSFTGPSDYAPSYSVPYHFENNLVYSFTSIGVFVGEYNTFSLQNYKINPSYSTFIAASGATQPALLFQVHDISKMVPDGSQSALPLTSQVKNSGRLVREGIVYLEFFDTNGTENPIFFGLEHIIPVQGMPNWVCVFISNKLFVGLVIQDSLLLWECEIKLNQQYIEGNSPYNVSFDNTTTKTTLSNLHVFGIEDQIYIYVTPMPVAQGDYIRGVIKLNVKGLAGAVRNPVLDTKTATEDVVKGDVTGNGYWIKKENLQYYRQSKTFPKRLPIEDITWNHDVVFSHMAYDYENKDLYGVLNNLVANSAGSINGSDKVSSSITSKPIVLEQDAYTLYYVDLETLVATNTNLKMTKSKTNYDTVTDKPVNLARFYRDFVDFGFQLYKFKAVQSESFYMISNGQGEYTTNISYATESALGVRTKLSLTTDKVMILPNLRSKGKEKENLIGDAFYFNYTDVITGVTVTMPFNTLQRQVTHIESSETSGAYREEITLGEIIEAEMGRSQQLRYKEYDFLSLTQPVDGYAITARATIKDVIKGLQDAYLFDLVEYDYRLQANLREEQTVRRTIYYDELSTQDGGTFKLTTPENSNNPSSYYLSFRDADKDYDVSTVEFSDPNELSNSSVDVQIPVVLSQEYAINLVSKIALATIAAKQGVVEVATSAKHSDLEVGDFINVVTDTATYTCRIIDLEKALPLVKIKAIIDNPLNYQYQKEGFNAQVFGMETNSKIINPIVIDVPPMSAKDLGYGFYVCGYSLGEQDVFSAIVRVVDKDGNRLSAGVPIQSNTPVAFVPEPLYINGDVFSTEEPAGDYDFRADLKIKVLTGDEYFTTASEDEMFLNPLKNTFLLGRNYHWEIIRIQQFYTSGGLLYGRGILRTQRGSQTDRLHTTGEYLISMENNSIVRINMDKNVTNEQEVNIYFEDPSIDDSYYISRKLDKTHGNLLAPVQVEATKTFGATLADDTYDLKWVRQTRYGYEIKDGFGETIDSTRQTYLISFSYTGMDPTIGKRVDGVMQVFDAQTVTLTNTQLIAIFGFMPTGFRFSVQTIETDQTVDQVNFNRFSRDGIISYSDHSNIVNVGFVTGL